MGQNKRSLCQNFAQTDTKVAGVVNWSIQISPAKVDFGVKLPKKKQLLTFAVWVTWDHPSIHAIDLTSITSFCFWMCGFAWAILPAMTSGVMVAEEVALLWILPRLVLSTCCTITPDHLSGEELYHGSRRLSVFSAGESWEGNRCLSE